MGKQIVCKCASSRFMLFRAPIEVIVIIAVVVNMRMDLNLLIGLSAVL